ncbi:MAG: ribosomal protein S18-alanine N-acetyltransferase [Bacillota bacterium]
MSIEPMNESNLPGIINIEKESFRYPWSAQSFRSELEINRHSCYLVARCEGEVAGYIGAWIVLEEVHITTLAVKNEYRRRGVATYLFKKLLGRVKPKRVRYLTLEVRPSNTPARKFYEKLGFRVLGRRLQYYPDEDALIMNLEVLPV